METLQALILKRHKLQQAIQIAEDEVLPHADNQAPHLVNIHRAYQTLHQLEDKIYEQAYQLTADHPKR